MNENPYIEAKLHFIGTGEAKSPMIASGSLDKSTKW